MTVVKTTKIRRKNWKGDQTRTR